MTTDDMALGKPGGMAPRPKARNPPKDLVEAIERLRQGRLALVFVKEGRVVAETGTGGIAGYLEVLEKKPKGLEGSASADRIVGKASAFLSLAAGVSSLYGEVISSGAIGLLRARRIPYWYGLKVPFVMNRTRTGLCPFEGAVLDVDDPVVAMERLKEQESKLRQGRFLAPK